MKRQNHGALDSPHRMIKHHDVEEHEDVMDAQEAVVEIAPHLSRGENPHNDNACQHRPAREAHGCEEN